MRRVTVRDTVTAAVWACALFPVWFLFVGEWDPLNAMWGAGASVLTGVTAAFMAGRGLKPPALRLRWLSAVPSTVWQTAVDFGVVTAVLVRSVVHRRRGPVGHFVRTDSSAGAGGRRPAARRAWLTAAVTWSPNAYVIDIDPDTGQALLHDLRPRRASEEPL
ncbi:MAG TPA: hypothetical protein VFH77_11760 [Streptomyces sp.]|nr:hypothetical protein [Streptomyces sp.]